MWRRFESRDAHAICEEYRAAATIDREHDKSDARGDVGSCVRSWPCGGRKGRSIPGTSRSLDRSRFGKPGAMMFKDAGSTPATFSRKRFPNKLPRCWAASSA